MIEGEICEVKSVRASIRLDTLGHEIWYLRAKTGVSADIGTSSGFAGVIGTCAVAACVLKSNWKGYLRV